MAAKAPKYGQTRSGTEPTLDDADFTLGQDPNYTKDFAATTQGIGQWGRHHTSEAAHNAGDAGRGAATVGQRSRDAAADHAAQIGAAQGRATPGTDYGASRGAVGRAQQTGQDQTSLAQRLEAFADGPAPDSGAQAMLTQGTNDALNAQLALARSGSGFGENQASLGAAGRNAAAAIAAKANESAALKAREGQAFQDQRLQAYGQAADIYGADRAAELDEAGLLSGQEQYLTDAELRAQEMNDAAALGWAGAQNDAYATANQGFGTAADAYAAEAAGHRDAYGLELDAWGMGLDAEKAGLEGRIAQEGINADIYNAELGHQTQMRDLDQKKSTGWVSGALGAAGAVGGIAAMFSDERLKKNIRERDDLAETYAALADDEPAVDRAGLVRSRNASNQTNAMHRDRGLIARRQALVGRADDAEIAANDAARTREANNRQLARAGKLAPGSEHLSERELAEYDALKDEGDPKKQKGNKLAGSLFGMASQYGSDLGRR